MTHVANFTGVTDLTFLVQARQNPKRTITDRMEFERSKKHDVLQLISSVEGYVHVPKIDETVMIDKLYFRVVDRITSYRHVQYDASPDGTRRPQEMVTDFFIYVEPTQ